MDLEHVTRLADQVSPRDEQSLIDHFDEEIARTRQNARLMALLDERARQGQTIPLAEVKQQLDLAE